MKQVILILCFFISGCATPYGPSVGDYSRGGYEETELGFGHYKIDTIVNGFTEPIKAKEYFYTRAQELCNGGNYIAKNTSFMMLEAFGNTGKVVKFPAYTGEIVCE